MALKLYTDSGNYKAFKALIAAEYNGVAIEVPEFKVGKDNTTADFLKKSPMGRVPALETPSGCIFESNAIARYVARMRNDTGLYGTTFPASGEVDAWVDFCANELELAAALWVYPVLGTTPANPALSGKAKGDLQKALKVVDNHLADKTYMVGHAITLADIAIVSALVYPFKFVADAKYRGAFPNVMRWFDTCVHQPQFEAVIGNVVLAAKEMTASGVPAPAKKEEKKKAPKEEKKKEEKPKAAPKPKDDEDEEPKPEKKEDHLFKIMDKNEPSEFSMDTWKKTYSNCSDYKEAMNEFWKVFEGKGWSIFRGEYKYNEENKVLFMTSNLIGGFIQRTEEIRKWLFGTMTIRGSPETMMKVTGIFLIRGHDITPLIKCNDDAECYDWKMVAGGDIQVTEEFKKTLYDYWCSEGPLDGEECLDSRCYK